MDGVHQGVGVTEGEAVGDGTGRWVAVTVGKGVVVDTGVEEGDKVISGRAVGVGVTTGVMRPHAARASKTGAIKDNFVFPKGLNPSNQLACQLYDRYEMRG